MLYRTVKRAAAGGSIAVAALALAAGATAADRPVRPDDRATHGLGAGRAQGLRDYGQRGALSALGRGWLEALNARSDAMNRRYGLGEYARRSTGSRVTPGWLFALNARSEELNRRYGLGTQVAVAAARGDAVVRPDDRADRRLPGLTPAAAPVGRGATRPDDRATRGPGTLAVEAEKPDAILRPDDRADRGLPAAPVVALEPTTSGGFDWADAGIGAAAAFGVVLLIGGASVMRLRHGAQPA